METKKQLVDAIIKVMNDVSNIEKSMTVGSGTNSYKGVSDKDVKNIVGKSMAKNGLVMLPIEVDIKTTIERWEETNQYGTKMKQSVFADANCKYLLLHTSGESQIIAGAGHGVDSQDKASGKSLTYAMKGAILQTFMIPTGEIDDTDKNHSDDLPVPNKATKTPTFDEQVIQCITKLQTFTTVADLGTWYTALSDNFKNNEAIKKATNAHKAKLEAPKA